MQLVPGADRVVRHICIRCILVEFYDKIWTVTLTDIYVIISITQGRIPLRHLVYRVHALPMSMRSLVWDFGQLNPNVEELYTRQIVRRYVSRAYNGHMQNKTVNDFPFAKNVHHCVSLVSLVTHTSGSVSADQADRVISISPPPPPTQSPLDGILFHYKGAPDLKFSCVYGFHPHLDRKR